MNTQRKRKHGTVPDGRGTEKETRGECLQFGTPDDCIYLFLIGQLKN